MYDREGKITKKFQEGLKSSFAMASKKDQDLYTALDLIIHHNIPITKFRDHEFSRHFNWKIGSPHYQTIVDTMVELFFVVNDSIAGEITNQKGVIHHDGWSKDGVHYVGLLATYPVKTDKITPAGEAIMEPVTSALAFSPLPKADYKGKCLFYYGNHYI